MSLQQYDVLIVGGGPAGSSMAWALKDSGLKIAILDKQQFPRDKICAGWVTPEVMQALDIDLDAYAQQNILQAIHAFSVARIGQTAVTTQRTSQPLSYSIRRCEFDHYLLQRSGAELLLGQKFQSMHKTADGWRINDNYEAKLVVAAGGHFCPVVRQLGARLGEAETIVAAQELEFAMNEQQAAACPVVADIPELYFCEDLSGYGWVVRKQNYLNIGLGREDNHKLAAQLARFRQYLIELGRIPADTPAKFHGHAYLLYPRATRPLLADKVLVIGDAAGLAYPQSGEGIRPAVESGLLAAQVVRQAQGDYSLAAIQRYQQLLVARFGQRQQQDWFDAVPAGLKQMLARQLLATRWFVQRFVVNKWFLQQQQSAIGTIN